MLKRTARRVLTTTILLTPGLANRNFGPRYAFETALSNQGLIAIVDSVQTAIGTAMLGFLTGFASCVPRVWCSTTGGPQEGIKEHLNKHPNKECKEHMNKQRRKASMVKGAQMMACTCTGEVRSCLLAFAVCLTVLSQRNRMRTHQMRVKRIGSLRTAVPYMRVLHYHQLLFVSCMPFHRPSHSASFQQIIALQLLQIHLMQLAASHLPDSWI